MRAKFISIVFLLILLSACSPLQPENPNQQPLESQEPGNNDSPVQATSSPDEPYPGIEGEGTIPGQGYQTPYPPAEEGYTERGGIFVDTVDLLIMESFPIQVALQISGNLPTPCNRIQWVVSATDGQNKIAIELYSLVKPGEACIEVLEPFDISIPLGSFTTGHYEVLLNGEPVGEFDAP